MTSAHATQRKQDLEALLAGHYRTEQERLELAIQQADAEIAKGPERVAAAIAGAHESEKTILRMFEEQKTTAEEKLEAFLEERAGVQHELDEVDAFINHKRKAGT
jgi:hypothetical protein